VEIDQIEIAINNIQHDIYKTTEAEYLNVTLKTNGCVRIVEFIGIQIWNDEDDMREYINEEDDIREPLEEYLRRQIRIELRRLRMIEV